MKILFIWPGISCGGWNSLNTKSASESTYANHGYMMMSAVLKKHGHEVGLLDMREMTGWVDFERRLAKNKFDIGAMGFMSCDADTARIVGSIFKQLYPNKPLIMGGVHLSANNDEFDQFPYADCVVRGEGEYVMLKIVNHIADGKIIPRQIIADPIMNLDDLPFADRTLFTPVERNFPLLPGLPSPNVTMLTSRGCPYRCRFCNPSGKALWGPELRYRSVGNVMEELRSVRPIGSIMFHSDMFGQQEWLSEFISAFGKEFEYLPFWCQLRADFISKNPDIIRGMAEVGMVWCSLGLESGSERMLKFLHKGTTAEMNIRAADILHANGVNIFANLIAGLPTETEDDLRASLEMARKIRPAWWSANLYTSFPGSDLDTYVRENDLLTEEHFSRWVYPFQRKLKGVDYEKTMGILDEIRKNTRPVVQPKKKDQTTWVEPVRPFPLVSVMMRSYNRPVKIQRAISSILSQTYTNWELIITDDASPDPRVGEVLSSLTDPRIKVIRNDANRDGHCILLNQALDHATGEYIGFCDDDDVREPEWIEILTHQLNNHPDWQYVVCQSKNVNEVVGTTNVARGIIPENVEAFYSHNHIDLGEIVLRRSVFDKVGMFDERVHYGDDWEFISRIIRAGLRGGAIENPLCVHFIHDGGQLNTRKQAQKEETRQIIMSRQVPIPLKVAVQAPQEDKMEYSHRLVRDGIRDSLQYIDGITPASGTEADVVLVPSPYLFTKEELSKLRSAYAKSQMVAIHTEDPPALSANLERTGFFDWVFANDASCLPEYRAKTDKVGLIPTNSVNTVAVGSPLPRKQHPKWDMAIVGYGYDSRLEWFKKVKDGIDWKLLLVGRKWEAFSDQFEVMGDQSVEDTMMIYADTKIICCLHRLPTDLGFSHRPYQTPARGYMETYSGAVVMLDNTRPLRPHFNDDEIVSFNYADPSSFLLAARNILKHGGYKETAMKGQARAIRDFTYIARIRRLLMAVRSPRFNVLIP